MQTPAPLFRNPPIVAALDPTAAPRWGLDWRVVQSKPTQTTKWSHTGFVNISQPTAWMARTSYTERYRSRTGGQGLSKVGRCGVRRSPRRSGRLGIRAAGAEWSTIRRTWRGKRGGHPEVPSSALAARRRSDHPLLLITLRRYSALVYTSATGPSPRDSLVRMVSYSRMYQPS